MKIGIVLYPTFGGSGIVATELGKALSRKNHQVHFITYSQPVKLDVLRENIFYHEVSTSDYPLFEYTPYEQVLTSKLVDVVKYEKLDLLHVHYAIPHASAAYMAQKILSDQGISIPFITTLHGTDITLVGKDPSFEPVITFSINHSNIVTAVSENLKKDTLRLFNITKEIEVIPNFISLNDYKQTNNDKYRKRIAKNNEKIITHISNFRKVKRIQDVLKTFKIINENISSKLILVGDGPERSKMERLARKLDISENVNFLGNLKSTKEVLNISDLFILPSSSESFGLAALEALACGVPVIATNNGGIPELVENGESGFLSDVGNVEEMSKNASHILSDKSTHQKFISNAVKRAKKFDIKEILPMYENIYRKSLETSANK